TPLAGVEPRNLTPAPSPWMSPWGPRATTGQPMSWREVFVTRFGPPIQLCGLTFGDWLRVLRENDFAVDPPYWLRALSTTLGSITNSMYRRVENRAYGPKVAGVRI